MAIKDKFYGIPIPPLNFILRVKKLNKKEQRGILDNICKVVEEYKPDATLSRYIINLMSIVVYATTVCSNNCLDVVTINSMIGYNKICAKSTH